MMFILLQVSIGISGLHYEVYIASSEYTCIWLAFACICCFPYEVNTALSEYRYTCIWLAFAVFIRMFV